ISILLPALGQAREQGKIAKCCSNLRQIGMYHGMYLDQESGPTWHLAYVNDPPNPTFTYNNISFPITSEYIYGGFEAPLLNPQYGSGDWYVIPTEMRPLNAVIFKPSCQGRDKLDL